MNAKALVTFLVVLIGMTGVTLFGTFLGSCWLVGDVSQCSARLRLLAIVHGIIAVSAVIAVIWYYCIGETDQSDCIVEINCIGV